MEHHEDEDLKRIAPTLHSLRGRQPFVVPDGFFDRFPHAVQARAVDRAPKNLSWLPWSGWLVRALPVAMILGLIVWWTMRPDTSVDQPNLDLAEHAAWDPLEQEEVPAEWYADAPGMGPTTIELDDNEWVAWWEEQDLLDLYLRPEYQ